jgi:hypothetical protein
VPTIKVPEDLKARLDALAAAERLTLAGVIGRRLDVADEADFWRRFDEAAFRDGGPVEDLPGASLKDGLDPDETWEDIL